MEQCALKLSESKNKMQFKVLQHKHTKWYAKRNSFTMQQP